MFGAFKTAHKLGSIGAKWAAATSVDPGDNGQVVKLASQYINNMGMEPEDAWLTAMVNWMTGMPWPDSQKLVAQAMLRFLNTYEGKIVLSSTTIIGARSAAMQITTPTVDLKTEAPSHRVSRATDPLTEQNIAAASSYSTQLPPESILRIQHKQNIRTAISVDAFSISM